MNPRQAGSMDLYLLNATIVVWLLLRPARRLAAA
jgi:hypothetical protein